MRLTRLFHLLTLLALLLAPAGMLGSHAAMAMPHAPAAATAMNHCDMGKDAPAEGQKGAMIDCAIACSAMPSAELMVPSKGLVATASFKLAALLDIHGMRPEAATPPPRTV